MRLTEPPFDAIDSRWRAELALEYECRSGRTVLAARRHDGPLVVQKPLYPEGDAVCHGILVHPPGGIVGGDSLALHVRLGANAHTLLTTPGAGKWYRSAGAWAHQHGVFEVGEGACLEWLPQETIVFDGALAALNSEIRLARNARYIGWEIVCLGRSGSGERFRHGECGLHTTLLREDTPLWLERGRIVADGRLASSMAGLGGRSVCGTLLATIDATDDPMLEDCRQIAGSSGDTAVTRLPGLLVARYLGDSSEAAKRYFIAIWARLRPVIAGRAAVEPRIWRT
jgi:urease accessory protein